MAVGKLTDRSTVRVLLNCDRLNDFKRNPQQFIDVASEAINRCKRLALVDGIKYVRLGEDHYYAQELFEQKELTGYLKNMLDTPTRSVYEQVLYDSPHIERSFAQDLQNNQAVRLYAKLPGWFTVPTPLGAYNPDWAVLIDSDGSERLYFVVETKSSLLDDDLREKGSGIMACAKVHFNAIAGVDSPAAYVVCRNVDDLPSHKE